MTEVAAPMTGLNVITEMHDDPIGTIAIPFKDQLSVDTVVSFMKTDYRWADGRATNRLYVQGSQLPLQRNEAAMRMQGDWLVMVDSDMAFGATAIGDLVASYHTLKEHIEEPIIVGGLCVRRYPPYQPTLFKAVDLDEGPFNYVEDWEDNDYVEVDATGGAFLLVEKTAFEAIMGGPFPSYEDRLAMKPWPFFEWVGTMGEDMRFCLKARAAGVRIFVDTRIRVGHVGEKVFGIKDFWHEVAERPPEAEEARRTINDAMGLPTLTAAEARERAGL